MFNSDSLKIIPGTDPVLRKKSNPVENPKDQEIDRLIKQMVKTLHLNHGIGLAAPQVGKLIRLFIVELDYNLYVMINPEIKKASKDKVEMEEGCLSFPGIFKPVERSKKVTVSYWDQQGRKKKLKAKGFLARAMQHEMDHLDGILFIDRCKN